MLERDWSTKNIVKIILKQNFHLRNRWDALDVWERPTKTHFKSFLNKISTYHWGLLSDQLVVDSR